MTPNELGVLLVERMQEVVPAGFTIEFDAAREMLWFKRQGTSGYAGTHALHMLVSGHRLSIEQRIRTACELALDDLQDLVDEESTEPWPGTTRVPRPGALIDGGQVHLWYGDIEAPALRLRPIPLADPGHDPGTD